MKIRKKQIIDSFFDISFLLYLIAYFYHYTDDLFSNYIRMIATITVFGFGAILTVVRFRYLKLEICTSWYFVFLLLGISSILWAEEASQITSILVTLIRILLIGFFLNVRIRNEKDIENVLNQYVLATLYMILRIGAKMIEYYSLGRFFLYRFGDNFGYNSNTTAVKAVFAFLICAYKINNSKRKKIWIVFAAIMLATIFCTGSKKGILGLVIGGFLLIYLKNEGTKKAESILAGMLALSVCCVLIMNVPFLYERIGNRFEVFFEVLFAGNTSSSSTVERIELIRQGFKMWIEHPLLGVGLNNFSVIQTVGGPGYYAHNNYIEILAGLGTVGFVAFYAMPFFLVIQRTDKDNKMLLMLKAILVVILFFDIAMVSYQMIEIQVFYWIFSMAFILDKKKVKK